MTPGIGFALGAMFCFGAGDLIYKRAAAAGIDARQFIMLQSWVFCLAITLYAWVTHTLLLHPSALWGSLAGFSLLAALYNFVNSLKRGAVITNAPIFRLNFTVTTVLAVLPLGETLNIAKVAALACALIAAWLLLAARGAQRARFNRGSLIRLLTATVAMGRANLFHKIELQQGALPETMVTTQS
jgi:drug/metabolite transporter (DMT)-like permease